MALKLSSNQASVHYSIGLLLSKIGRTDEAELHYKRALEIDLNHIDAHNNLGILLANTGRLDEGIAHFHKALEVNPRAVRVLKNLAVALGQRGQLSEATGILQNALALARSAGDEVQTQQIAKILGKFQHNADAAMGNSTMQAPQ